MWFWWAQCGQSPLSRERFRFIRFFIVPLFRPHLVILVGSSGLEPPTSCLSGTRSNHLSYEPLLFWVCGLSVRLLSHWWRWWDSNPWPSACRADALPTELHPHTGCLRYSVAFRRSFKIEQQMKISFAFALYIHNSTRIYRRPFVR